MAGAGYKLFNTGDVLTAQQVNEYLMQQTTMVFASAAARTSALSGVLAEGMVSYLQDTNTLEVYDGSAWVGATGDITGLTAGTGITISSATGPVPTITNSVATTFDALGDLVVGTGADTFAKLTVGNSGDTIVADSSASVGLRYQEPKAGNPVLNSSFQIWQRGTSTTDTNNAGRFIADRWQIYSGASGRTYSRQLTNDTTNLPNIQYCMRVARDSGNTATNQINMGQNFETVNSIPFAGKSVVLSFYARAGANYSATSSALGVKLVTGTGTDQNGFYNGYTGETSPINTSVTLTTTWQRFSVTGTIGATTTELLISFLFSPTGTAGANDYYEITGVQLEVGSVASPFKTYAATLAGELCAAQRYYYRTSGSAAYQALAFGAAASATSAVATLVLPVTMRTASTDLTAGALYWETAAGTGQGGATVTAGNPSRNTVRINIANLTGLTAGQGGILYTNNDANSYLAISAEL